MNETEIAESLKANIPQDPVAPAAAASPETTAPKDEDFYHTLANPLENTVLKQQLSDYLGVSSVSRLDTEVQKHLDSLLEWAVNESQSRDLFDVLTIIGRKEAEMGIRSKGDKLARLYRDIKISKQIKALDLQRKALYG